ncbi:MAG: GPW/gp25 family protein [Bacteroidales bacterium]|nr:GPW/gp25 family protein [Bacteroidales bacterium]
MAKDFLQIPLQAGLVTRQKELKRSTLTESVADMIRLITITHFGENKQDESFGNELWENDFETIDNVQVFKEKLAESLQIAVTQHERRLSGIKVNVGFEQVMTTVYNRRVRQRIQITIEGTLRKTNEPFTLNEVFFMGPLSYY